MSNGVGKGGIKVLLLGNTIKNMNRIINWCSFFFFFSTVLLHAQQDWSAIETTIDSIFYVWDNEEMPGGVVGVFKNGELIIQRAYGMASLEYEVPNTTETVFNIASVSKQFTAFSMVLLEQQGKLSLEDDIRKHLPEVPDFGAPITIRHLLHHTSGLRNFQNMLAMAGWREGEAMTNEDLLRYLSQQKELNFPTGEEYLYCNTGFNICTAIVERITGQTFQEWTKENIFEPLGMENTGYREDMEAIHKNTATCYEGSMEAGFRQPLKYWTYMGNGNVYTTLEDLTKWLNNFREPALGGPEGIEKLLERGVLNNGDTLNYALGIVHSTYRGLPVYQHGGSVGGYRSTMQYYPEQEVGVIVLSNFSSAGPATKAMAVASLFLKDDFTEPAPKRQNNWEIPREKISYDINQFDPLLGQYYIEGVIAELTKKEDHLYIFAQGQLPAPLLILPSSDTTFFVENVDLALMIRQPDAEKPRQMLVSFNGERNWGFQILPEEIKGNMEGVYYSPELDTRYTIVRQGDQLVVQHARHNNFLLVPATQDLLYGDVYFFREVKPERNAEEQVTGLWVSNGRVRNLWFEKL